MQRNFRNYVQYFQQIFYLFDNIFLRWTQICPGMIRIRNSELRILGSGSIRNIHVFGTLEGFILRDPGSIASSSILYLQHFSRRISRLMSFFFTSDLYHSSCPCQRGNIWHGSCFASQQSPKTAVSVWYINIGAYKVADKYRQGTRYVGGGTWVFLYICSSFMVGSIMVPYKDLKIFYYRFWEICFRAKYGILLFCGVRFPPDPCGNAFFR